MRSKLIYAGAVVAAVLGVFIPARVQAAPGTTIESGIFADDVNLSGMSRDEALRAVRAVADERGKATVTLTDGADFSVSFPVSEIGYNWDNEGIIDQAAAYGKTGDIVERYMQLKDLTRNPQVYDVTYSVDRSAIEGLISGYAAEYDREAVNASLTRDADGFTITDGQTGTREER